MSGSPEEGGTRPGGGGTKPGDLFDAEDLKALQVIARLYLNVRLYVYSFASVGQARRKQLLRRPVLHWPHRLVFLAPRLHGNI